MKHYLLIRKISQEMGWLRLAISHDQTIQKKRISILLQSFPLPQGFSTVDALNHKEGVMIFNPMTYQRIARLGCWFADAEECWADMLPVISKAYVQGWQDGCNLLGEPKAEDW